MSATQPAKLLNYLEQHKVITRNEAFVSLGIAELSKRIGDLELLGWVIEHKTIPVLNRDGKTVHVTEYKLISGPERVVA